MTMVQLIKLLISSADTKLKNQLADALLRNGKQWVEIQLDAVATVFDVRELRHRKKSVNWFLSLESVAGIINTMSSTTATGV